MRLEDLIAGAREDTEAGLTPADWIDDDIKAAIDRHPDAENDLFHSFRLLVPTVGS
jgi:hypothetical protein